MRTLLTWLEGGGPFMPALLGAGAVGIGLVVERLTAIIQRSRIHTRPFIERVVSLAGSGRAEEALALCVEHNSALPDLGLVLLRSRIAEPNELLAIARAATLSLISDLRRREHWVPALIIVILLLGIAGGAVNLHDGLAAAGSGGGGGGSGAGTGTMSAALAAALRPLGASAVIAIPLVLGHAYVLEARAKLLDRMEEFSARLVNALSGRPDVRLGHRD